MPPPSESGGIAFLFRDALDLVEGDLTTRPVIQLLSSRRFVCRDRLGVLDGASVLQICSDARRAECVAARGGGEPGWERPPLHHPEHIKTGLDGVYDFALSWNDDDGPTLPTALREQLGLRLDPQKVPIAYFVIDSAQRPSAN